MYQIILYLLFTLSMPLHAVSEKKGDIHLTLSNLKEPQGKILITLHNDPAKFPLKGYEAYRAFHFLVGNFEIQKKSIVLNDIPFGQYAIILFHDVNSNGKLDKNLLGLPKESVGVSNDARGLLSPPKFKDAKFKLETSVKKMTIELTKFPYI